MIVAYFVFLNFCGKTLVMYILFFLLIQLSRVQCGSCVLKDSHMSGIPKDSIFLGKSVTPANLFDSYLMITLIITQKQRGVP